MHDRPLLRTAPPAKQTFLVGLPQSQTSPQAIFAINGEMCRSISAHRTESLDDEEVLRHSHELGQRRPETTTAQHGTPNPVSRRGIEKVPGLARRSCCFRHHQ